MTGRDAYAGVCARAVLEQAGRARRLAGPARAGRDAGAVHDLRVASRRLRAALSLLEAGGVRRARAWRKAVRRVTRALGRARDLDVQIGFLRAFLRRRAAAGDLALLLGRLEARRREAQGGVVKALKRTRDSGVLGELTRWARRGAAAGRRPVPEAARALAAREVRRRLRDVAALAPCVSREDAADRHHRLRIAAKRLRYALEVFLPVFGRRLGPRIAAVKALQEILGELHDCDVWTAILPADAEGFAALRGDRARRRRALYRRFAGWWEGHGEVWASLGELAAAPRLASGRPAGIIGSA